jgi:hypothetical protein
MLIKMSRLVSYFIAFHDAYYPENTRDFTPEEIEDYFIWYSVARNPIKSEAKVPVLLRERFLAIYDGGRMQEEHWYQNSMFFHLYWNPEIIRESRYVGFGQYDFELNKMGWDIGVHLMDGDPEHDNVAIGHLVYPMAAMWDISDCDRWNKLFVQKYNEIHGTSHDMRRPSPGPFLCHAFIIPTWFFMEMMEYIASVMPQVRELAYIPEHYAGTLERAFAIYINFGIMEQRLRRFISFKDHPTVKHNHKTQRLADPFRGIIATPSDKDNDRTDLQDNQHEES